MAADEVTLNIPMRISPLFARTVKLDKLLRRVGLGLPIRVVAWATCRSVQYQISGKWHTAKLSVNEVMADAFG